MPLITNQADREPVLVSIGGLPATGKTTVARALACALRATYVRIDGIEAAIGRAEGRFERTNGWELPPGYLVGYDVATEQLRNGLDVVAESVNPLRASRDAWREAGRSAGARVVEVEIVCSDVDEHRRRAEERVLDVAGLGKPTWGQITTRDYAPWQRDRVVVDTAMFSVEESVRLLRAAVGA
ncbi:MAG: AAA family ATPase [Sciscionella sp.]